MEHVKLIKRKAALSASRLRLELDNNNLGSKKDDKHRDSGDVQYPCLLDLRKGQTTVQEQNMEVTRIFVRSSSSSSCALCNVGWVLNEASTLCMHCGRHFGTMTRKHHCRACGILMCRACSLHSRVENLDSL
eukprot:gene43834-53602_t